MTASVQKIIEEVKALSIEERRELEAALSANQQLSPESQLAAVLEHDGLMTRREQPLSPSLPFKPIPIAGASLSSTIVHERR
jgi:hypothetical protein